MASPATSSTIIMSSTWASVVPAGTTEAPPPFRRPLWPSSRVGFAPIPTKSGASRASGWICGSRERRRPGPAHRGQRRTRPPAAGTRSRPDTAEDCGSDCGSGVSNWARTPTGFDSSSLHRGGLDWSGTRADPRGRGPPCVMQATRTPVPMAVSSPSGGLHRHEHDGCPTTISPCATDQCS